MPDEKAEPLSPLEQFAQDVREEVRLRCAENAPPDEMERGFTEWCLEELAGHNEADNADVLPDRPFSAQGRRGMPAAKLNAWALSGDGATLDLFVALYHGGEGVPRVGVTDTRKQFKLLLGFLRRARAGLHTQTGGNNDDASEIASAIHGAKDSLTTVRLFFLTDGEAQAGDIEEEKLDGLELRYVLWDLKKFSQLRVGQREVIELDFESQFGGSIPCLAGLENTPEYQTYLAFMPGRVLARIYGEQGQRLLERNVRAYLGKGRSVNKGMQKTINDEPHRFLAYNNGLCCTAADVRLAKREDRQMGLAWARDFQIVNGGQTTASIYHAMKKERLDIAEVMVQVKLTVLNEPGRIGELVPQIARYANSQNKVNAADLAANGPFHLHLEQLSREVWAPAIGGLARGTHWYYERARGSYLDEKARKGTPARRHEWEKQNPKHQKFTKTDLAKYEHAWLGLPHWVCFGAEKNFVRFAERMEDQGEPEVNQDYFRQAVAKAILWRTAEKLFDTLDLEGYRANSVAYALAWLAEKSGRRIDLNRIWSEQRVPPGLFDVVKTVCKKAWEHLNHQQGNVGEASKKAECWESFRAQELPLSDVWLRELADKEFVAPATEEEALRLEWERVRHGFVNDSRTIRELEAATGRVWMPTRRGDPVHFYAEKSWEQLRTERLRRNQWLGIPSLRGLVEMFAIAAQE